MSYRVLYKKTFLKELKKLPKKTREKIEVFCFDVVPETGNPSEMKGIEKLTGFDTFYKVRFGDYRVGLEINSEPVYKLPFFVFVMPEVSESGIQNISKRLDSRSKTCGNDGALFEFMDRL